MFIINTSSHSQLYQWRNWENIYGRINLILLKSDKSPYIRTFQNYENENRWLGFGRMKWNDKNNRKWTEKYLSNSSGKKVQFHSTEIWAPDWNVSYRSYGPPDFYIQVYNYDIFESIREGIIIVIKLKLYEKDLVFYNGCINLIHNEIINSTISKCYRSWMQSSKFPNRIEDINVHEINTVVNDYSIQVKK